MDWNQVEGNWKQVRGNVKKQWGKLTDDDLTAIDGRREVLEGRNPGAVRIHQGSRAKGDRGMAAFLRVLKSVEAAMS